MTDQIRGARDKHPSGKPQKKALVKDRPFQGRGSEEPLSPGLRKNVRTQAVGFLAALTREED